MVDRMPCAVDTDPYYMSPREVAAYDAAEAERAGLAHQGALDEARALLDEVDAWVTGGDVEATYGHADEIAAARALVAGGGA